MIKSIAKLNPFSIWISRSLAGDSIFSKLTKSLPVSLTAESLIDLKILKIDTIPKCDWIFINSAFALNSIMHLSGLKNQKKLLYLDNLQSTYKKMVLKVDFIGEGSPTNVAQVFSSIVSSKEIVLSHLLTSL